MINPLNFTLTYTVTSGKILKMDASWTSGEHDPIFIAYLIGVNPLTGTAFENELFQFSSGFTSAPHKTLAYHGTYTIQVRMKLGNDDPVVCYETKIKLNNPDFRPHLFYKAENQDGFVHLTIECNCWKFSYGKVWLVFNGQRQPLLLKNQTHGRHEFYLATSEIPGIEITDPSILKEERSKL